MRLLLSCCSHFLIIALIILYKSLIYFFCFYMSYAVMPASILSGHRLLNENIC